MYLKQMSAPSPTACSWDEFRYFRLRLAVSNTGFDISEYGTRIYFYTWFFIYKLLKVDSEYHDPYFWLLFVFI